MSSSEVHDSIDIIEAHLGHRLACESTLAEYVGGLLRRSTGLREENRRLATTLSDAMGRMESIGRLLEEMSQRNSALKQELSSYQSQSKSLQDAPDVSRSQTTALQKVVDESRSQTAALQKEVDESERQLINIETASKDHTAVDTIRLISHSLGLIEALELSSRMQLEACFLATFDILSQAIVPSAVVLSNSLVFGVATATENGVFDHPPQPPVTKEEMFLSATDEMSTETSGEGSPASIINEKENSSDLRSENSNLKETVRLLEERLCVMGEELSEAKTSNEIMSSEILLPTVGEKPAKEASPKRGTPAPTSNTSGVRKIQEGSISFVTTACKDGMASSEFRSTRTANDASPNPRRLERADSTTGKPPAQGPSKGAVTAKALAVSRASSKNSLRPSSSSYSVISPPLKALAQPRIPPPPARAVSPSNFNYPGAPPPPSSIPKSYVSQMLQSLRKGDAAPTGAPSMVDSLGDGRAAAAPTRAGRVPPPTATLPMRAVSPAVNGSSPHAPWQVLGVKMPMRGVSKSPLRAPPLPSTLSPQVPQRARPASVGFKKPAPAFT